MSVNVCLSVCLSVRLRISKSTRPVVTKYSVVWSSLDGNAVCYILGMMSCFYIKLGISHNQRRHVCYCFSYNSPGGASRTSDNVTWLRSPGGVTGSDVCRLRLHLVTSPAAEVVNYCNEHVSLCVCLSVCPRAYLPNHMRDLYQIFRAYCLYRGSVLLRRGPRDDAIPGEGNFGRFVPY